MCEVCDYVCAVCTTVANSLCQWQSACMCVCERESTCWSIPTPIFCSMLQLPQPSELDQFWIDFNFGGRSMSTYIEDSWEGSASSSTDVCMHSARQTPIHVDFGRIPTILLLVTLFPISPQGGSLDQCGGEEYRHSLVQAAGSHRHHCPGAHTEAGRRHPHPQLPHQQRQHSTQALLPWSTL